MPKDKVYYIQNKKNYKFFKRNICNELGVNEIFNNHKIEAVVHFAAETHVDNSIQQSDQFVKTNILGTHNLIKICKDQIYQNKRELNFGKL